MRSLLVFAAFALGASAQPATRVLSQDEIQQLEATVAKNPGDRPSQVLLGKNYAFVILGIASLSQYDRVAGVDPAKARGPFAQHARDELGKSPLAGVVGEGGETLWVDSTFVQSYLYTHRLGDQIPLQEARTLGAQALDRAVALEPENPTWRRYRIPVLVFRSDFKEIMPLSAADAYAVVKQDMALLKGMDRAAMLQQAAKLSIKAEALDDAGAYARELVATAAGGADWNQGNAVFYGNMVLGQVALRRGDKEGARSYLLASGKSEGSPQLNSFGPNMSLAKDLLAAGEQKAVLDFFDLCGRFWKTDRGRLKQWAEQVRTGSTPDFGANLLY